MKRLASFLAKEIRWGWLAGIALGTTLLAVLAYTSSISRGSQILYFLALSAFIVGGVIVGQGATRHPFWNALIYGLFCILFTAGVLFFYVIGTGGDVLALKDVGWTLLSVTPLIIPQSLAGAWVANSFRRIREVGEKGTGEGKGRQKKEKGDRPPGKRDTRRRPSKDSRRKK